MKTCEYCGSSFDDEDEHLAHLADEHRDDLGPIDERRVANHVGGDRDLPMGALVLGGVIVAAVLLTAFAIFGMGGGNGGTTTNGFSVAQSPGAVQSAHEHGTINVTIDDQQVDFSQPRYQAQERGQYAGTKFHFEGGNGRVWHTHAEGVTLEYAMATLGFGVDGDSVTWRGTTYTDGENAEVIVQVNGQPVDPSSYVLSGVPSNSGQGGDQVRIVVRPDG